MGRGVTVGGADDPAGGVGPLGGGAERRGGRSGDGGLPGGPAGSSWSTAGRARPRPATAGGTGTVAGSSGMSSSSNGSGAIRARAGRRGGRTGSSGLGWTAAGAVRGWAWAPAAGRARVPAAERPPARPVGARGRPRTAACCAVSWVDSSDPYGSAGSSPRPAGRGAAGTAVRPSPAPAPARAGAAGPAPPPAERRPARTHWTGGARTRRRGRRSRVRSRTPAAVVSRRQSFRVVATRLRDATRWTLSAPGPAQQKGSPAVRSGAQWIHPHHQRRNERTLFHADPVPSPQQPRHRRCVFRHRPPVRHRPHHRPGHLRRQPPTSRSADPDLSRRLGADPGGVVHAV